MRLCLGIRGILLALCLALALASSHVLSLSCGFLGFLLPCSLSSLLLFSLPLPLARARARALSLSHTHTYLTEIEMCSLIMSQHARGSDAGDCGSRAKCATGKGTLFC